MCRSETLQFRKATVADVKGIHRLVNSAASRDEMLPRSLSDIYDKVRDFHICVNDEGVVGSCALHIVWEQMAEIRSLAVDARYRKAGIGRILVERCIEESRELKATDIFVLTYIPGFFAKLGFEETSKDILPHKVWSDCVKCPKFPDCGEVALIRSVDAQ